MNRNQMDQSLSERFANMALLCAMLVVFIHLPKPSGASAQWIWAYLSHGIAKVAVPFFFVAAGFFLAGKFDEKGWYGREVIKRVKTLLLPLFIWDVAWVVWSRSITIAANAINGRELLAYVSGFSLKEVLRIFALWPFEQPELGVLWFVRVLFLLVLCSPLLRKMSTFPFVGLLWMLHGAIHPDYGATRTPIVFTFQEGFFSLFGMAYFCLGIYLRSHVELLNKSYWLALVVGGCLLAFRGVPYVSSFARVMTWLATPFLLAGVWTLVPARPLPAFLKATAFPIYLLHGFAIFAFGYLHLFPSRNAIGYILIGILTIATCIFVTKVLRRFFPRFAYVAFGGR